MDEKIEHLYEYLNETLEKLKWAGKDTAELSRKVKDLVDQLRKECTRKGFKPHEAQSLEEAVEELRSGVHRPPGTKLRVLRPEDDL